MSQTNHGRFHDETGSLITPGRKLGEGGEGTVYVVENQPAAVMKIWRPGRTPPDADAKLRHMVQNPVEPDLGAAWLITWPQHLVKENGVTVGFTMPILDPIQSWEPIVEYYNRRAAQNTEQEQGRELRIDDRVRMARNLALGFRAVHHAGYVIGDVNEKNVEVNRQNDIAMVDCDSYGFTETGTGRAFYNRMGRPEFQAPEAQGDYNNRTQNHDRFGLAVIVFHLLTGYHPYTVTNRPDHPLPGDRIKDWLFPPARQDIAAPAAYAAAWSGLTARQQELFRRCFDRRFRGQPRPTPEQWIEALQEMPTMPAGGASYPPRPAPPTPSYPGARRKTPVRVPPMEKSCPTCQSRDARIRRDWHRRSNALRCRSCNGVFGKTLIKRCPNCASQEARLRRDWHSRGRPFRCLKCNTVFGGTDQTPPAVPPVDRTPNLERYLQTTLGPGSVAAPLTDRARGVMLGVVVGNLLGLPIEGRSRRQIQERYPSGVTEIRPTEMTKPLDDDPAQAMELAEALLEGGDPVERFAARLVAWSLLNGRGMGRTTRQSINQLKDKVPPPVAAYAVYRAKGENSPNGGIMRCAPVAIARRRHPELLVRDTADTCAVSHYAPASQWSCVIVNAAIAMLLSDATLDLRTLLEAARADGCPDLVAEARAAGVPTAFLENAARGRSSPGDTKWMRGNRGPNGHTVLTMQAGLWAATTPSSFEDALVALVSSGGDTDTNGALAGAVLGARYGASAIPSRWITHVAQRERLMNLADRLAEL